MITEKEMGFVICSVASLHMERTESKRRGYLPFALLGVECGWVRAHPMRCFVFPISLEASGLSVFLGQGVMSREPFAQPWEVCLKDRKSFSLPKHQ